MSEQIKGKRHKIINWAVYVLSFLISMIGMLLILKSRGFYPFKDATLFVMDMQDQYLEFFASLRYLFDGSNSIFYSWSRSMGGNYLGLFAYYVASPLSFLTVFFSLENMPMAIVILTLIKIGLAGLSFSMFASYMWNKSRTTTIPQLVIIPLAVAYALMSYNMTFLLCLMWLDGVILLPWIILGVEKLLDGKKGYSYVLALTLLFYSNYYTGYMVGIFAAIYFCYRLLIQVKKDSLGEAKKKVIRFTINSLLAIGLAAPLLVPVARELIDGRMSAATASLDTIYNFQPFSLLFRQLSNGVYGSLTNAGMPAIYCGCVTLIFVCVFFLLRRISLREKLGAVIVLILFAISFYFKAIDLVWHGFQSPNWFPYRYAFLCSFFMLYMAVSAVCALQWSKLPNIRHKKPIYECIAGILMLITAADMGINGREILLGVANEFGYSTVDRYEGYLDSAEPLISFVKEQDNGLYRVNQGFEYSKNDAMLLGYNGMTHYSSNYNEAVNELARDLGLAQMHFWNTGYGSTPLTDSLFAIKYILEDGRVPSFYSEQKITEMGTTLYLNQDVLPMVYGATRAEELNLQSDNPFDNQNYLLNNIAGTNENFYTEYEYEMARDDAGWSYTFVANSSNPVYFYMATDEYSFTPKEVYVNDELVGYYFTAETKCCLYLGEFTEGELVKVHIPEQAMEAKHVWIEELHMDVLRATLSMLCESELKVEAHHGSYIEGEVIVPNDGWIMTSIPYDEGWSVMIDGKKVKTQKYANTFLVVPAEKGVHNVTFRYVSHGVGMGIGIGIVALLLCGTYYVWDKNIKGLKNLKKQ